MKELLLLRHAKSEWRAAPGRDFERPLTRKGEAAADSVGRLLEELGLVPDLILASSANRARTTAARVARAGGWSCPCETSDALYETEPFQVEQLLSQQPEAVGRLLLVGHNPTWEGLLSRLIGGGRIRMATATVAVIQFPAVRWPEVALGTGTLLLLVTPKVIRRSGPAD